MIQSCATPPRPLENPLLVERLTEIAELLDAQQVNPYRVQAYRNAADTIAALDRPVHDILRTEGSEALLELSGIGQSIARSLDRLTRTGRLPLLEQLRSSSARDARLVTVLGIGRKTAKRIHEVLGIETLADLEAAAHDGWLAAVPGIGRKRLRAVRESLAGRLRPRRVKPPNPDVVPASAPPVADLLSVDEEYRSKAERDRLLRVAPRRFNPGRKAWLPILRTRRASGNYTALYSNTARAHDLGTHEDWVIVHRDAAHGGGQWTVVTSLFGELRGRRIVTGRERECADHYAITPTPAQAFLPFPPLPETGRGPG